MKYDRLRLHHFPREEGLMKKGLLCLVSLVALAGCASIKLDGNINVCTAPGGDSVKAVGASPDRTDNLSIVVRALQPVSKDEQKTFPGLVAASVNRPSTSRISDEITSEDIAEGRAFLTNQVRMQLAAKLAKPARPSEPDPPTLLPWLYEVAAADFALRQRAKEAN